MSLRMGARSQAALVLALVALFGVLLGVLGERVLAQRAAAEWTPFRGGPPGGMGVGMGGRGGGPEARGQPRYAERLDALLDLTPSQRAAIDSIMTEQRVRIRELNREMEPRFRAIAEDTRTRVESVLTDEQRTRLRGLRQDRMRGGPGMGPRPPGGR